MADVGRPPLYDDPLKMEAKIEQYFDRLKEEGEEAIPSVAELAFELGFASRNALWEYEQKPEFSDTIKKAKLRIEVDRTKRLITGPNTAGVIFDLTNNYGWKNPQHLRHGGDDDAPPIETKELTDVEYARRVAFSLQRATRQRAGRAEDADAQSD